MPHVPPPRTTAVSPADDESSDGDVPPPVADALAFLRDQVPPDSLALLSTRGNSLDSLGAKDTEAVQPVMKEVIGALTAARGKGLARPECWLLLLSMPRWLLAKPPEGTPPADALQERAHRFFSGGFESLWIAHKWEDKMLTLTSHARRERRSEEERGAELVAYIRDAARKRRLGQAVARMMDAPSVPLGNLAYAQLRQLLCADVQTAERATLRSWRARRGLDQPEAAMRNLSEDLRSEALSEELVKKWRPKLAAARYKKQPASRAIRVEAGGGSGRYLRATTCRRFEDDYSPPPGPPGARGSAQDRARPMPGAA